MKHAFKIAVAALASTVAVTPVIGQGIPVHDNASLLQHIQTVRHAIQQVQNGKDQIAEAKKLYTDLNKLTDIAQIASQLKADALRLLDTQEGNLQGFGNGRLDVVGRLRPQADKVYRDLLARLGAGVSKTTRDAYDLEARNIGIQSALATGLGQAAASRGQGLDELRNRLASAGTAKEIADLTARLSLESAAMQNDALRLEAVKMQDQAEARMRAIAGRAALLKQREQALKYWRGEN